MRPEIRTQGRFKKNRNSMPAAMPNFGRIVTRGRRFIPEVDGLRFVAIAAVVLFHLSAHTLERHMAGAAVQPYESWLPRLFGIGHYGVHLFFVLSGFLLAAPFAKWRLGLGAKPSLQTYYLRRLTRLEPPYMLAVLVLFAGGIVALGVRPGLSRWPNLLASLIYQHNLIFGDASLISVVLWSLEIEVQFYILAPFLSVVFSVRNVFARRVTLLCAIIVIPLLRSFIPSYAGSRFNSLPWYLEFFAAGFLLADLYLVDWKESPGHSVVYDIASLVGWPVLAALMLWNRIPILIAPVTLVTCIGAFRGKASSWLFRHRLITAVGGMCYSMYLLHYGVISVTGRLSAQVLLGTTFTTRFALDSLIALPAVLAATGVFFIFLERPCMDPSWPSKAGERIRRWFAAVSLMQ
jgi:peptidoglycan/LPS O-acetylase OafA/YrhL